MALIISRALQEAIGAEARREAPRECCGLLLGQRDGEVSAIRPADNVAPDPLHCFEIDPTLLLAAFREARSGGPQILGHYHSHPGGPAVPSKTDALAAERRGEVWVIAGADGRLLAWRAGEEGALHGCFTPEPILSETETGLAPSARPRH